jgi:hypothetical protein
MAGSAGAWVSRRAVLAAGAGSVVAGWATGLTGLGAGVAAAAPGEAIGGSVTGHPSLRAALRFLDQMMDAYPDYGTLRLPQSHTDQVGLHSTAFSYDAAVAILAYLVDDTRSESLDRARLIGDALLYAQAHDADFADGRLRQAYNVGPYTLGDTEQPYGFVRPDGTVNVSREYRFIGTLTGDVAWAGLALATLARRTFDVRYLAGAVRLADWVVTTCGTEAPFGGFRAGIDRMYRPLRHTETAHNATLVALFGELYTLSGATRWRLHRQTAANFVERMWEPGAGFYYHGSAEGRTVTRVPVTAEAQTLAQLALRRPDRARCLEWLGTELAVTDTDASPNSVLGPDNPVSGITFSDYGPLADPTVPIEPGLPRPDPDAVWLEGTGQLACALLDRAAPGDLVAALDHLNTLAIGQDTLGTDQTVADRPVEPGTGVVAASSPLHTGIEDTGYYPCRAVAATAWFLLAATSTNPYRGGVADPTSRARARP